MSAARWPRRPSPGPPGVRGWSSRSRRGRRPWPGRAPTSCVGSWATWSTTRDGTRPTEVVLAARSRDDRVLIRVDDDGPGIPPEERERVFERFARLDDARARDAGGSGLGLAIVRELARSRGGDVRLGESPTGGLRAEVDLPAREQS